MTSQVARKMQESNTAGDGQATSITARGNTSDKVRKSSSPAWMEKGLHLLREEKMYYMLSFSTSTIELGSAR